MRGLPTPLLSSTVSHLLTKCPPLVVLARVPGTRLRFSVVSVLTFLGHTRDFAKTPKLGAPPYISEIRTSERTVQARTLFRALWMNLLRLLTTECCLVVLPEPSACDVYIRAMEPVGVCHICFLADTDM